MSPRRLAGDPENRATLNFIYHMIIVYVEQMFPIMF